MDNTIKNQHEQAVRDACDRMLGTKHTQWPCKYPECSCGKNDRAVIAGTKAYTQQQAAA